MSKFVTLFLVLPLILTACGKKSGSTTYHFNEDTSDRTEISCPVQNNRTMVMFTFGQSNSANALEKKYDNTDTRIVNYFNGKCYIAKDPLLGPDGTGGSQWVATAQKLMASGNYDAVVINAFGVGGTSIKRWSFDGELVNRYQTKIKTSYTPTHFLWHQGEADVNMSKEEYMSRLTNIIQTAQAAYPSAKFYVSKASYCLDRESSVIRSAQSDPSIINNTSVFQGPNTDEILDRWDNCHLSALGQDRVSTIWAGLLSL